MRHTSKNKHFFYIKTRYNIEYARLTFKPTQAIMSKKPISDQDLALFRAAMHGVTPLKTSIKIDTQTKACVVPPKRRTIVSVPIKAKTYPYLSDHFHEPIYSETIVTHQTSLLATKQMHELKRGDIPIQGRLDMHGLRPDAAREALLNFIERQQHLGNRCVIIIHGKGGRQGEAPILKNLVIHWLKQIDAILGFHSALPRDGGTGAVLALLRRNTR